MRILVACPECNRRYDASKRKIGSRFRCLCGEILTVRPPREQESAVIRCSSCGSPREQSDNRCGFCGADFTIHERDLHTVCPQCLARVSDRARYCSHCGCTLTADMAAGEQSEMSCPCCGEEAKLASRQLTASRVSVLECPHCAGLWLSAGSFKTLRDQVAEQKTHVDISMTPSGQPRMKLAYKQERVRYRKCIVCGKMMHRRQYGRGSGVILDTCREHGIWFDEGELHQVLEWIRLGGRTDRPVVPGEKAEREPSVESRLSDETIRRAYVRERPRDFLDEVFDGLFTAFGNFLD